MQVAIGNCAAFIATFSYLAKDGWVLFSRISSHSNYEIGPVTLQDTPSTLVLCV